MQTRTSGCEVPSPARARGRAWAVGVSALLGAHVLSASAQDRPRDDPPPTAQDCNTRLIRVEASGLPFRAEGELCDPIPYLQPVDPCWARWGLDTNVPAPHAWGLLEHTVPQPNAKPVSACWHEVYKTFFIACREGNLPINLVPGYSLNINLLASPSIGDFLPPAATLGASSVALVPQGAASAPTGWRGLQRPVHEGAVDLITGSPLARTSELELPFAGAAFRLVRTRSHSQRVEVYACHVDDTWWDWTGNGWMASEAPLLLIDSAVPDIVGDNPRTTYLVLDAHHSIPFQRFEDSGRYEAPARFRAGLTHNGQWGAGGWITPPTWYKASLYDGALTYTFVVVREDVPLNIWSTFASTVPCQAVGEPYDPLDPHSCVSSMHARPFLPQQFGGAKPWWDPISLSQNPGQGLPFYGLCTRIEDRYGHVVEISYGSQTQYALDNPQSPPPDEPPPPGCVECLQDCPGKGQIRSIRLRRGAETYWTLLYRYRIAPADPGGGQEDCAAAGQLAWGRQIPVPFDHFGTRVI
ncbi:MAG TPA: hypothetical protein VD963_09115, partial [Phycisphaerales bacterium]|nr:hypothetical protein [Phycisphaerales bacterium]